MQDVRLSTEHDTAPAQHIPVVQSKWCEPSQLKATVALTQVVTPVPTQSSQNMLNVSKYSSLLQSTQESPCPVQLILPEEAQEEPPFAQQ